MLLALAMRMAHIGTESVYLDEAFSIWYGQQRLGYLLEGVAHDTNPPLHFLLLKYWMELFGRDETAARLLSAVLSVCTIPFLLAIGRRFFDPITAIAAGLLFAASDIQVFYSHEARTYTLVVFLTTISLWCLFGLMEEGKSKFAIGLAISNALLLHSHYAIYGFLLMEAVAALVLGFPRRRQLLYYFISQVAALALFVPWAIYFSRHFRMMAHMPDLVDAKYLHYVLLRFAGNETMKWGLLALIALGLPIAIWQALRLEKSEKPKQIGWQRKILALVLTGFGAMMLNYVVSAYWLPTFKENYVLFATISIYLLIGWIWSKIPIPSIIKWLFGAVVLWFMVSTVTYHYRKISDWRGVASHVKFLDGDKTLKLIGLNYLDLPFLYYYDYEAFKDYRRSQAKMNAKKAFGISSLQDLEGTKPETFDRVLLIDGESRTSQPGYGWIAPLEAIFGPAKSVEHFNSIEVWRFEKPCK
jgi:uncharacterized membrane protein